MPIIDQTKVYTAQLVNLAKQNLIAIGYQNLTVDGTAGGLALTVPADAKYALVVVESADTGTAIRYLETGPLFPVTTSNGIPRSNLDVFDIQGYQNLKQFRAIRVQSGTTNLQVQYYK